MKKVLIITNVPAPYRVDLFYHLQTKVPDYEFHILYSSVSEKIGRQWHVDEGKMLNSHFLKSKVFTFHRRYDDKQIILPYGVERTLLEIKPDIVIGSEYNPTILKAVHWCKHHQIPYISWSDGTRYSERGINNLQKKFRQYVIKRSQAFVGSSTKTMENQQFLGADPKKCFKSLLTVDVEKYFLEKSKRNHSSRNLLYVGSLIVRKGIDLLLEALPATDSDIVLTIVGEGGEKQALMEQVERLHLQERVVWKGFLEGEALKQCYRDADAFVLPTREDCFGLVILEAMCASLPVIASKYADGAYDLLEEGKHGFIVDPYRKEELAGAITQLFEKEEKLCEMQRESYERAHKFTFDYVAEGIIAALKYGEK